jgi:hypothetical protein
LVGDSNTGNLFLLTRVDDGTNLNGGIFLVDTLTGAAMIYHNYPFNYYVTGCAISPQTMEVFFGDGILAWYELSRATLHKIWTSDEPDGPFTHIATTPHNWWRDPAFPQDRKFHRVTAVVNSRTETAMKHITGIRDRHPGELLDPQPEEALKLFRRQPISKNPRT